MKVVFTQNNVGLSSLNSYGYSPHPLSMYLSWIEQILTPSQINPSPSKPFIISITASDPTSLRSMIDAIQVLRTKLYDNNNENSERSRSRVAIELNTSCPNIRNSPPAAYSFPTLSPLLHVLADEYKKDETLTIGLKLPPYVYREQFVEVVDVVGGFSFQSSGNKANGKTKNPFAFFTCTNTLGNSLLFAEQITTATPVSESTSEFAVPPGLGGLAGESIHALSLGNVYTFVSLLREAKDEGLAAIQVIGVGGVTSKAAVERMRRAGAAVIGCATLFGRKGVLAFEILGKE